MYQKSECSFSPVGPWMKKKWTHEQEHLQNDKKKNKKKIKKQIIQKKKSNHKLIYARNTRPIKKQRVTHLCWLNGPTVCK